MLPAKYLRQGTKAYYHPIRIAPLEKSESVLFMKQRLQTPISAISGLTQNTTIKGKTWSRGTNSREPFGLNVNLNLFNISNKESEYISQKLHLYMRVCIA